MVTKLSNMTEEQKVARDKFLDSVIEERDKYKRHFRRLSKYFILINCINRATSEEEIDFEMAEFYDFIRESSLFEYTSILGVATNRLKAIGIDKEYEWKNVNGLGRPLTRMEYYEIEMEDRRSGK